MNQRLSLVSLVVADYDEAIVFFTRALDFELCEDTPLGGGKRWVVVRPAIFASRSRLAFSASSWRAPTRAGWPACWRRGC
jgi:catechol 2,3-dioxygenase-like lactoylglutathione lyase family enzyme